MSNEVVTVKDAAYKWVQEFNAFPRDMIKALMEAAHNNEGSKDKGVYTDTWEDVTPPAAGDPVHISKYVDYDNDETMFDLEGEIIKYNEEADKYEIKTDFHDSILLDESEFESRALERIYADCEDGLPMWGTMWQFGDSLDDDWLENEGGLQIMADCGFRIFHSEEFGYFWGIHGAGYDFYEQHWIPLYLARGLKWHTKTTETDQNG